MRSNKGKKIVNIPVNANASVSGKITGIEQFCINKSKELCRIDEEAPIQSRLWDLISCSQQFGRTWNPDQSIPAGVLVPGNTRSATWITPSCRGSRWLIGC